MEKLSEIWRAEGRKEAMMLLMEKIDPETVENSDLVSWAENGMEGDYSAYWKEEGLRELFMVGEREGFVERLMRSYSAAESAMMENSIFVDLIKSLIDSYQDDLTGEGINAIDRAAFFIDYYPKENEDK